MWYIVVCLFILPMPYADGSLVEMTAAMQLCCRQGTTYARNHTVEDCSSSIPPRVPPSFESFCIFAMDQCCKEYFTKKIDCDNGIDVAKSSKHCGSTKDSVKKCCDHCKSGALVGKTRGEASCIVPVQGNSTEQILADEAFEQCCKNAVKDYKAPNETKEDYVIQSKPANKGSSFIPSLCEEYAPNELCAHHCLSIPGSYKCECDPGFMLMPDGRNCKEVTKNRCKPHNPCKHKCIDNGIEVKCSCKRGYQLMSDGKSCEDINECILDPPVCLPNTQCFNVQGSYKCIPNKHRKLNHEKGQCPPGFAKNVLNNACDDVNECKLSSPPCPHYLCENTIGGYKCGGVSGDPVTLNSKPRPPADDRCPPGFKGGFNEECEDVDECVTGKDDCNKLSQFCINTRGSFHCQDKGSKHCPAGFKTNSITNKCEDINECEDGQDICKPDQICVNVLGEYDCKPKVDLRYSNNKCPIGMRRNTATNQCDDIDECVEGTHLCDQYQNCLNTNGSHECHCKLGFTLDPTTGACTDINECATEQNNCIPGSQRCDNTVGSFLCIRILSCGTGYIIHHTSSTCEDIDECALGIHNCAHAGPSYQCVNYPGSFRCEKPTPAPPEYEYEYYDTDEEIEEEDKNTNKTEVLTTTTPIPTTAETKTTPAPKPTETTIEDPKFQPTTEVIEENFDNSININMVNEPDKPVPTLNYPKPAKPTPQEPNLFTEASPETSSLRPELPQEPTTVPSPYQPNQPSYELTGPIEPRPSETETERAESEYNTVSYPKVSETTYSPLPETPTSPKVVFVNYSEETATVVGQKINDGSVFVDTSNVPKHEWTKINERPTDCQIGFEMDMYGACFDIDECATNQHSCSGLTETCRNTMGGYMCTCAFGFIRDLHTGSCSFITSSSSTTTSTTITTTSTTTPAPTTSSTKSYLWSYPDQRSMTSRPFRPRNTCDVGYHLNSQTGKCEDIDECRNGQAVCASGEICMNNEGGYRCECLPNWRLDPDRHRCVPARNKGKFPPGYNNMPAYPHVDPNTIIPGTKGGRKIANPEITQIEDRGSVYKCPWGTRLGDDNTCEDIDECATGEAQCGPLQVCTNLPGGYTCSCPVGHRLIGDHQCEDVDECSLGGSVPVCSQHGDCVNTIGSYQCQCHHGFTSAPNNDKICVDVDECDASRPGALCEHRCNNDWGSYHCSCHRGYRINKDNRTCSDVDECKEFKHKNLCIGRCINEPGSYRCTCPPGYRLSDDRRSCIDIDECETGVAPCAHGAQYEGASDVCLNTRGGYRCHRITCPPGYELKSKHRCSVIVTECPPSDWECSHKPSTYSYNFFTFVSNLYIPESKVDLFTMRGPPWPQARMIFQLRIVQVDAPPSVTQKADINAFLLVHTGNQAVTSLVRPLEGPQSIELELSMTLFQGQQFGGIAVAKLYIFVSEYEF